MTESRDGLRMLVATTFVCALMLTLPACGGNSGSGGGGGNAAPSTTAAPNKRGGVTYGPADSANPQDGGRLVFGMEAEPEGLDPTRYAFSSSGHMVAAAVFDPLAKMDADGNPVPYLAKAIDPSDNYTTWTLTIPEGITFHDDTPLTAQIVADNLEAMRKSLIAGLAFKSITSISAPNVTTVVIKVKDPFIAFPGLLADQPGLIVAPAMLADPNLVDHPIGTGPFVFDRHDKEKLWSLKKNTKYWRQGLPHLDSIDLVPIPDSAERVRLLQQGDLDMIHLFRPEQVKQIRASNFKVVENSGGEEDFLILNTEKPPFDNLNARKAVAFATDSARWRSEQQLGVEQPANSPFAPGQVGYLDDNGFPTFNLDKASQYVKDYEKETGKKLEFTLLTQEDIDSRTEGQFFLDSYEKAGMKATLAGMRQINLVAATATGSYTMVRFRLFSAPNPDVDGESFWDPASVLPGGVSLNFPRFKSATVSEVLSKAKATSDEGERQKLYERLSREFAEQLPYIWLGRPVWLLAANPRVNGIYPAANGSIQTIGEKTWLAEVWIKK